MAEKNLLKLCGLWKRKDKEGKAFYSGSLSYSTNLLLFSNSYKKDDDKQPDLLLYIVKREQKEKTEQNSDDSEIPF